MELGIVFEEAATCVFFYHFCDQLVCEGTPSHVWLLDSKQLLCLQESEQVAMSLHQSPLVGEEQQAAGSSDRADQLQNNNFSAAGGAKLLGLDPPTCPVVCCCWTQSGSHRLLLLQGQTRLQWLQPKIGLGRRPLRAPKMLPLFFVCLCSFT